MFRMPIGASPPGWNEPRSFLVRTLAEDMVAEAAPGDSRLVRGTEDLLSVFYEAEKPPSAFRIGAEQEKIAVHAETGAPLTYGGEFSVSHLFSGLVALGWQPEQEVPGGPVIALRRGGASVTLEPGSQFELSGAPLSTVHEVREESAKHLAELAPLAASMNLVWLGVGFQPIATQAELDWVPKQRYAIMREYLPPLGRGALDMMRRTATVQVNLDFSSEEDAMRKLRTLLVLSPLIHAMTANSPFVERRRAPQLSHRGEVWLNMDPTRSGLIPPVLASATPRYLDYVEWALDAGMFLFKRDARVYRNTGQTFRDFLAHGYEGERATVTDWKLHLNTLFPEVRLKNTLEARACDGLPEPLAPVVHALFTGIAYDDRALAEAEELSRSLSPEEVRSARPRLVRNGLAAFIGPHSARALAERVVSIAEEGLARRARLDAQGRDERVHLAPLIELVGEGKTPAEKLLAGLSGDGPFPVSELIARTRL